MGQTPQKDENKILKKLNERHISYALLILLTILLAACSTEKNTSQTRWWHSFNTRYNVYYNGSVAYIDGSLEKERGNQDNYTELIPLYTVGNKSSISLGKGNFDRAIEKSQKAIQLHSIKRKPIWDKSRRKTPKDIEWLNRREYNPFLWKAWLLMGRSQFHQGAFDEASSTFAYMSRIYRTQPHIYGKARAWLAKTYIEQGWMYDAEDVIRDIQRDSLDWRAVKEWDYTFADYYIHAGEYEKAIPYLRKVIKHEMRRKQKAREWFLMGQLLTRLNKPQEAFKAFKKVISLNPPYQLELNARIAMTEVMPLSDSKKTIKKLRRMAVSDNNKDYLDQVFYAIGNIYMAQKDTLSAISAYEEGAKKGMRSGPEKGVLLLKLGNIYWEKERFGDARRCYNEALGMLDKERDDYQELSKRSKVLDELVPYTDAVHLQDSLQALAKMSESDRNKAIDRVIEALKKKEKEEKEAKAMAQLQSQTSDNTDIFEEYQPVRPQPTPNNSSSAWYFYNPLSVSQGKALFERQWGKRENVDNWQRHNKTVVALPGTENEMSETMLDSLTHIEAMEDSIKQSMSSPQNDPHKREYYLAQIPFTPEQLQQSNTLLTEGLFHSGVIFKDKLDHLPLSEKALMRVVNSFPNYENMPDIYYHLFLLYSRMGMPAVAQSYIDKLKTQYPTHQWTTLLTDPHFYENASIGVQMEDSLYAATYDAFKAGRYGEVRGNVHISDSKYLKGANRDKFIFIGGLSLLNEGNSEGTLKKMQQLITEYPQSKLSEMAGMILNGVKAGRRLHGGKFDVGNVWERRNITLNETDTTQQKQLSNDRNANFMFMIAYLPDSINENQLLFELAKYNFTNYLVRNFDINIVDTDGLRLMQVTGFLNYDEALQYARQLHKQTSVTQKMGKGRAIIISEPNYELLGKFFSYDDYDKFYNKHFAPLKVSTFQLLTEPAEIVTPEAPIRVPTVKEIDDALEDGMFIAPEENAVPNQPDGTYTIPEDVPAKQQQGTVVVEESNRPVTQPATNNSNGTTVVVTEEAKPTTPTNNGTVVVEETETKPTAKTPETKVKTSTQKPNQPVQKAETPLQKTATPTSKASSTTVPTVNKPAEKGNQDTQKAVNASTNTTKKQPQTQQREDTGIYFNDGFGLPQNSNTQQNKEQTTTGSSSKDGKQQQEGNKKQVENGNKTQSNTNNKPSTAPKQQSKTQGKNNPTKQNTSTKATSTDNNSKKTAPKEPEKPKKKSLDLEDEYYDLEGF